MKKLLLFGALLCVFCSCRSGNSGAEKLDKDVVKEDRLEYKEYVKLALNCKIDGDIDRALKYYAAAEMIEDAYNETAYSNWFNLNAKEELAKLRGSLPTGVHEKHAWVDLGLSVKWATCNVGASNPSEFGDYYFYGRYVCQSNFDEAPKAAASWGGKWRMPTVDEWQELINCCTWIWTVQNGHAGYKIVGTNGQSIFLPAAGSSDDGKFYDVDKHGCYWSYVSSDDAYTVHFDSKTKYMIRIATVDHRSVRPVLAK